MGYNSIQNLLFSNSTVPNFVAWGSAVSAQIAACGFVQSNDTGQIVWTASVVSITNAVGDGTTTTYTYTLTSGPPLRVGMSIVVTGCTTGAFNQTKNISALGSGTFSVLSAANHASEAETATGTVNAVAAVPSSTAGYYEVWQSNDGLPTFYFSISYGQNSSTILVSVGIGTATNGAGALSGFTSGTFNNTWLLETGNATVTSDCYFCGSAGRLSFLLGRSWAGAGGFVVERTKNSDGTDNSDGVYINSVGATYGEGTIVFGVGASTSVSLPGYFVANLSSNGQATLFNNQIAIKPIHPMYGKIGYPITSKMIISTSEATEGSFITTTLYGATRTYIVTAAGANLGYNLIKSGFRFD